MVKLHNSFAVETTNGKLTAYNTVNVAAAKALAYGTPWAKYLMIFVDGKDAVPLETERVFVNCNCNRGTLQAVYSVCLEKDMLVGERITGFALSCDGKEEINSAEFPPFVKAEEETVITATVFLSAEFSGCTPIASDDNPLILALLGGASFFPLIKYAQWGTCETSPDSSISTTVDATENRVAASVEITPEGIRFAIDLPASALDAVLFLDDKPVMRVAARAFCAGTLLLRQAVTNERTVGCTYPIISSGSAAAGLKQFTDVQVLHVPKGLIKSNSLMLSYDRSLRLISDPSYRSAAFVSDKELFMIGQCNGRICVLSSLACSNQTAHMTDWGEVVLTDNSGFAIYHYVENEGMLLTGKGVFENDNASDVVVSKRNRQYSFLRKLQNGQIERGYSDGGGYEILAYYDGGGDMLMFRNRYCTCLITPSDVHVFEGSSVDARVQTVIKELRSAHDPIMVSGYDGLIHIQKTGQTAFNYAYAVGAAKEFLVAPDAQVQLCGDFILVRFADGRCEAYYYYRETAQFIFVAIENPQTIADIARIGNSVLVRRENGALEEYGIMSDRSYLFHPLFEPGENTDCVIVGAQSVPPVARRTVIEVK